MKLTWENVTVASRIMLPAYVALFTILGINWLFIDQNTVDDSPGLRYADGFMPIAVWGFLFFMVAFCMGWALWQKSRVLFRYALIFGGIMMVIWSGTMLCAAALGGASWSAWTWAAFVTAACAASNRSLLKGEL